MGIGDSDKDEVGPEEVVLGVGAEDGVPTEHHGGVGDEGSKDEGDQLDGEVREGTLGDVGQDDLGGHATKDNANSDSKEDKVLLLEDVRVRGREPGVGADKEQRHGQKLRVGSNDRLVLLLARLVNSNQAKGKSED